MMGSSQSSLTHELLDESANTYLMGTYLKMLTLGQKDQHCPLSAVSQEASVASRFAIVN